MITTDKSPTNGGAALQLQECDGVVQPDFPRALAIHFKAADPQLLVPTKREGDGSFVFQHPIMRMLELLRDLQLDHTSALDGTRISIQCERIATIISPVSVFEIYETQNGKRFAWERFPENKFVTGSGKFSTETEALARAKNCSFEIRWEPNFGPKL